MDIGQTRTDQLVESALTGLAARQRTIGDNVANADTPGFKASRVEFEGLLRNAVDRQSSFRLLRAGGVAEAPRAEPASVLPQVVQDTQTTRRADGNNVDIDAEMLQLAETNLTYNALTQITSSRLQLLRTVISEGRR
jgi:flagellar basal-body rod protein FlgB